MGEPTLHLVHGTSSALGTVFGAENVAASRDALALGPCDADPAKHDALRLAHWGTSDAAGFLGIDELARRLGSLGRPVTVWSAPGCWGDRLFAWQQLDQLARLGVDSARISIAWCESPRGRFPVSAFGADDVRAAWEQRVPVDAEVLAQARALWAHFTSPSPLAFDEARRRGMSAFPDLGELGDAHAAWFPWHRGDRWFLSEADQLLFDCLHSDWPEKPGWTRLLHRPRGRAVMDGLFRWFGDLGTMARFDAWCARGAVERRHGSHDFHYSLRITPLGERLRDEGLRGPEELAPVDVGGCRIGPDAPWARVPDGASATDAAAAGWRLARPRGSWVLPEDGHT